MLEKLLTIKSEEYEDGDDIPSWINTPPFVPTVPLPKKLPETDGILSYEISTVEQVHEFKAEEVVVSGVANIIPMARKYRPISTIPIEPEDRISIFRDAA